MSQEGRVANIISLDGDPELIQQVNQDAGLAQFGHPGILEAHLGSVMIRIVDYDGSQVPTISLTSYSGSGVWCTSVPVRVKTARCALR